MASPPPRPPPPTDSITAVAAHAQSPTFDPAAINTPPLPPPKPGAQAHSGPSIPKPLTGSGGAPGAYSTQAQQKQQAPPAPPTVEEGWLPPLLKEQLYVGLLVDECSGHLSSTRALEFGISS